MILIPLMYIYQVIQQLSKIYLYTAFKIVYISINCI
jgi:hypothetical protein